MVPIKIPQKFINQHVAQRDPRWFFRTIPVPVTQELIAISTSPDIQGPLDLVGWGAINHKGVRGRLRQRDQIWFRDWLQAHVESGMHLDTRVAWDVQQKGSPVHLKLLNCKVNFWKSTWKGRSFNDNQAFWPGWKGWACFLVCQEECRRAAQTNAKHLCNTASYLVQRALPPRPLGNQT